MTPEEQTCCTSFSGDKFNESDICAATADTAAKCQSILIGNPDQDVKSSGRSIFIQAAAPHLLSPQRYRARRIRLKRRFRLVVSTPQKGCSQQALAVNINHNVTISQQAKKPLLVVDKVSERGFQASAFTTTSGLVACLSCKTHRTVNSSSAVLSVIYLASKLTSQHSAGVCHTKTGCLGEQQTREAQRHFALSHWVC